MIWQDIVISVGQWIFIIALMPSIFSQNKPDVKTSLITAIVLTVFGFTFLTLNLIIGGLSGLGTAFCWWILFVQKKGAEDV